MGVLCIHDLPLPFYSLIGFKYSARSLSSWDEKVRNVLEFPYKVLRCQRRVFLSVCPHLNEKQSFLACLFSLEFTYRKFSKRELFIILV